MNDLLPNSCTRWWIVTKATTTFTITTKYMSLNTSDQSNISKSNNTNFLVNPYKCLSFLNPAKLTVCIRSAFTKRASALSETGKLLAREKFSFTNINITRRTRKVRIMYRGVVSLSQSRTQRPLHSVMRVCRIIFSLL